MADQKLTDLAVLTSITEASTTAYIVVGGVSYQIQVDDLVAGRLSLADGGTVLGAVQVNNTISATGTAQFGSTTITTTTPALVFDETDVTAVTKILVSGGTMKVRYASNAVDFINLVVFNPSMLEVDTDLEVSGTSDLQDDVDIDGDLDVTGAVTATGDITLGDGGAGYLRDGNTGQIFIGIDVANTFYAFAGNGSKTNPIIFGTSTTSLVTFRGDQYNIEAPLAVTGTVTASGDITINGDSKYLYGIASDSSQGFRLGVDSSGDGLFQLNDGGGAPQVFLYGETGSINYINKQLSVGKKTSNGNQFEVSGNSELTGNLDVTGTIDATDDITSDADMNADNFIKNTGEQVNIQTLTEADAATVSVDCLDAEQTIVNLTINRAAMTLTITNISDTLHINFEKDFATDTTLTLTSTAYKFYDQQNTGLITSSLVITRNNSTQRFGQISFVKTGFTDTLPVINVNAQIT